MNNKENKVNEEILNLGQGKRLIQFRIEKGFNSRLAFANELNISVTTINDVENNLRRISKNLLAVINGRWNDLNGDWLLYGIQPKLLTGNLQVSEPEFLSEGRTLYEQKCQNCVAKDKIIEKLRADLDELRKKYIECLEQLSGLKKASSG